MSIIDNPVLSWAFFSMYLNYEIFQWSMNGEKCGQLKNLNLKTAPTHTHTPKRKEKKREISNSLEDQQNTY